MALPNAAFARSLSEGHSFNVAGTKVTEMLGAAESGGSHYVFRQISPPASGVPPHVHSLEDEIAFVVSGELEVYIDGQISTVSAGALLNFARGQFHGFKVKGDMPCETIWFVSPGTNFQTFFREVASFPLGPPDLGRLDALHTKHGMTMPPPSPNWW